MSLLLLLGGSAGDTYTATAAPAHSGVTGSATATYTGEPCLTVAGDDDVGSVADFLGGSANLSAFAWVKRDSANAAFAHVVGQWGTTSNQRSWVLQMNADKFQALISSDGTTAAGSYKNYQYNSSLSSSTWYHLGFTFAANELKIYVDGSEVTATKLSDSTVNAAFNSTADVSVGAATQAAGNYFTGQVADVRIYEATLTAGQVASVYANDAIYLAKKAHWPCNEGAGTALNDQSGNNYDLTLSGGTEASYWANEQTVYTYVQEHMAAAAPEIGGATGSASATFASGVYTATAAPTTGGVDGSASAEFDVPVYTATAAPTVGGTEAAAAAEFDPPVYTASSAPEVGGVTGAASASFATAIFMATASPTIGGVDGSAAAEFDPPVYTASAAPATAGVTGAAVASFVGAYTATAACTVGHVSGTIAATTAITFLATSNVTVGAVTGHASSVRVLPLIKAKAIKTTEGVGSRITRGSALSKKHGRSMKPEIPDSGCEDEPQVRGITAFLTIPAVQCVAVASFTNLTYTATATPEIGGVTGVAAATRTTPPAGGSAALVMPGMWVAGTALRLGPDRTADVVLTHSGVTGSASGTFVAPGTAGTLAASIGAVVASAAASFSAGTKTATAAVTTVKPRMFASVHNAPPVYTANAAVTAGGAEMVAGAISNPIFFVISATCVHSGVTGSATSTFTKPVYTATASVNHSGVLGTSAATHVKPVYAATSPIVFDKIGFAASGTHSPPVTRVATAAPAHSGVIGSATAQFATAIRTATTIGRTGRTAGIAVASFTGGTTPLSQPNWLEWTENYGKAKMGVSYDSSTYETILIENNVLVATNSTQFAAHLVTARNNVTIDAIWLDPVGNPYTYPTNATQFIAGRSLGRPLVIRTLPGSATQANIPSAWENNGLNNIAYVDLDFSGSSPDGLNIQSGPASNILIEKCTGWITVQGGGFAPTPGVPRTPDYTKTIHNLNVRLCVLADHFSVASSPLRHGGFFFNVDGLLMEGNVIDHNGWDPAATRATDPNQGGATTRKHNIYFSLAVYGLICRYNMCSRASSHGFHVKGGGYVRRNLFAKNPINCQQGYGDDGHFQLDPALGGGVRIDCVTQDNVFLDSDALNTFTNDLRGTGLHTTCVQNHQVSGNLFLDCTAVGSNKTVNYIEQNYPTEVIYTSNLARNWTPTFLYRRTLVYQPVITQINNNWAFSGMTSGAQALADTLKSDSYLNSLKVSRKRLGVDIEQLKDDMDTIRAGAIVP